MSRTRESGSGKILGVVVGCTLAAVAIAGCGGSGSDTGSKDRVTLIGPNGEEVSVVAACAVVTEAEVLSVFGATGPPEDTGSNCHWGGNGPETTLRVFVRATAFGEDVNERRAYFADNASVEVIDLPDVGEDAVLLIGTRRYAPGAPEVVEVDGIVFQVGGQRIQFETGVAHRFAPESPEAAQLLAVARAAADRLSAPTG